MNAQDGDLDLSLAVTAWKTLWLEACNNQMRADRVWQPTQDLLDSLALQNTPVLTCLAGKYYMFPANSDGVAVNIFFVGGHSVAYLGTLLDPVAFRLDKESEVNRLSKINQALALKLASTTSMTIVRDAHFCKIPVDAMSGTATATFAIRRYLAIRAPHLAKYEISWLPVERGVDLENQIDFEAQKTARKPTLQDRLTATADDELELL